MARNQIQVQVPQDVFESSGADWMDPSSWMRTLRPDDADRLQGVELIDQRLDRETGCYVFMLQHPNYPDLAPYEAAPKYRYDQPQVLPG